MNVLDLDYVLATAMMMPCSTANKQRVCYELLFCLTNLAIPLATMNFDGLSE